MELPALKIGHLVSRLPIIQGGMGVGISAAKLASAVANEGGIGVIASIMIGMGEADLDTKNPQTYGEPYQKSPQNTQSQKS